MGKVLVIGVSPDPKRYSYLVTRKLLLRGKEVIAIGKREGTIGTCTISTDKPAIENVDLVLLYINSGRQKEYYNYLLQIKPRKIIFNPGTENSELARIASENNIEVVYDCALSMISSRLL